MAAKFELTQDTEGRYRFRLKAANGEVVADSQAYRSVSDARAGMAALQRAAAEASVPDDDDAIEIQEGIHMHY
jgi:uncharacterized protein YegP (UPF0339 family)